MAIEVEFPFIDKYVLYNSHQIYFAVFSQPRDFPVLTFDYCLTLCLSLQQNNLSRDFSILTCGFFLALHTVLSHNNIISAIVEVFILTEILF